MKKSIFYIFFLIILPVSLGSSDNTGCNYSDNNSKNTGKPENSQLSNPSGDTENSINADN